MNEPHGAMKKNLKTRGNGAMSQQRNPQTWIRRTVPPKQSCRRTATEPGRRKKSEITPDEPRVTDVAAFYNRKKSRNSGPSRDSPRGMPA